MEQLLNSLDQAKLTEYAIEYGTSVVFALLIYVIGKTVAKGVTALVRKTMTARRLDDTLVGFLGNVVYALLLAFVVIAALSQLGIETTSIAAIFAAAGLAVGLALQGSLSNFASGVLIIGFRPFKTGDYVEAGGTAGTVEEVGIFTTKLRTPNNEAVIVPNGRITSDTIKNYSAKDTRRLNLVYGISYDDDIRKAKQVIEGVLKEDERILADPAPVIAVLELADSSVNLVVRPWVKSADYWDVYFHLQETIKLRLDDNDITIPFPQRDVHLHNVAA